MLERCVEKQQEQGPRGDPVHERKHQLMKYEDTRSSLLKRNISSGSLGLTMRFFDFVDLRKVKPKNYVTERWILTIKTGKHGNFLRAKLDGYCEVPKINRKITCRPILLRPQDQDFG